MKKILNCFLIIKLCQVCLMLVDKSSSIQFDLKLVNIDAYKAEFEMVDDNITTINYEIEYELISKSKTFNKLPLSELTISTKTFDMQTNPIYLLNKQEQIRLNHSISKMTNKSDIIMNINNDETDVSVTNSGETYSSDEILEINTKSYEDIHRFFINDLESNKIYQVNFKVVASLAHLKDDVLIGNDSQTKKYFKFDFQSKYLAKVNCQNEIKDVEFSCYEPNLNCSKCKSNCYETNYAYLHTTDGNNVNNQIKQCLECPCDTLRSTGECHEITRVDNFYDPRQVVCKECLYPYTGNSCNDNTFILNCF